LLSPENLAALVLVVSLIMYAVFAGADFGGGIWTALASGPRAHEQRERLAQAIGPVWETNHVWLVLVVVTLFTAFPDGFAALFTALLVPFVIALIGITFRGAAFAFRHFGEQTYRHLPATVQIFALSSLITPLAMGMAVTASASGRIRVIDGRVEAGLWSAWVSPFTIMGGLVAVAVCAFITPVFMTMRVKGDLREDFRARAIAAALVLGAVTALALPVARWDAPDFFDRLSGPAPLALMALATVLGLGTLALLWIRHYALGQVVAAATVSATLGGFLAALHPYLVLDDLTHDQAAAPDATLTAFLVTLALGSLLLVPSLVLLYWTFRGEPDPELPPEGQRAQ
jgi:cytochrome bd ubiquinol oxidase subunit II